MSSLVTACERSVAGKMTRSPLVTRRSRPPASTIVASALAIREFYGTSARVVEDQPHRGPLTRGYGADAVAQADAVVAALAGVRAHLGGEDHEGAARRRDHVGAALGARALLHQHELAALVVLARLGQDGQDLEGE